MSVIYSDTLLTYLSIISFFLFSFLRLKLATMRSLYQTFFSNVSASPYSNVCITHSFVNNSTVRSDDANVLTKSYTDFQSTIEGIYSGTFLPNIATLPVAFLGGPSNTTNGVYVFRGKPLLIIENQQCGRSPCSRYITGCNHKLKGWINPL